MNSAESILVQKAGRRLLDGIRPVGRSWTVRLALLFLTLGAFVWIQAGAATTHPPALFRAGAGCLGGFLVGFIFRRLLGSVVILTALLLSVVAVLKATGLIHWDWTVVEQHLRESLAWTSGKLEAFRTFLTGYLPTGGATGWGLFRGARTRSGG